MCLHRISIERHVKDFVTCKASQGARQQRILVLAEMRNAEVENLRGQLLHCGVGNRLEMILDVRLPPDPDDLLTQSRTLAVIAVVSKKQIRFK